MGPIAVKKHLIPHLPQFSTNRQTHSISTSKYGSGSLLLIPHHYMSSQSKEDWDKHHNDLIETTRRVIETLESYYKIHHSGNPHRAHEFIIDVNPIKQEFGISEVDICKRLMDYGFHGPTMSWPLQGGLMIEITETEDDVEIERFVEALQMIKREIEHKPELLKNAPHTQYDVAHWSYDYSIAEACYPTKYQYNNKYWPTMNRLNDVYGDRCLLKK